MRKSYANSAFYVNHTLFALYRELKGPNDKETLARDHPVIAAAVFYAVGDPQLGGFIVRHHSTSIKDEHRQIASCVRATLREESEKNRELEEILGMKSVPSLREDYSIQEDTLEYHLGEYF